MAILTDRTEKTTAADSDFIHFVDISDTSDNAAGSSFKITRSNFLMGYAKTDVDNSFSAPQSVPADVYGAGWSANFEVPTKNALYTKIESGTINAGTLGGFTDAQFLRSDAADVKTSGNLTFNDNISLVLGTGTDAGLSFDSGNNDVHLNLITADSFRILDNGGSIINMDRSSGDIFLLRGDLDLGTGNGHVITKLTGLSDADNIVSNVPNSAYGAYLNSTGSTNYPTEFGQSFIFRGNDADGNRDIVLHKVNGDSGAVYLGTWSDASSAWTWGKVWTSENDGAGSGLDADTVDGIEGVNFLRSDVADTANGALTIANTLRLSNGGVNPTLTWNNGTNDRLLFRSGDDLVWRYDGSNDGALWHSGNTPYGWAFDIDSVAYETTYDMDDINVVGEQRFFAASTNSPDGGSGYAWTVAGGDAANRGIQFFAGRTDATLYFRSLENGTWHEIWNAGNDGSGSGLDADLLDGLEATAFARLTGGTFTGAVSVPDDAYADAWNGSTQVPTKNAIYDKIESLESFGAATFTTSNTSNTGNNKWTKFASIELSSQFNDYQGVLVYQANNHPDAANAVGHISLRAKQQAAFGNDPVVSINNWYFDEQATTAVTVGYVIVQNTPSTIVDFYIRINDTFCVVSANALTEEWAEPDNITWYSSQAFEGLTPSGLVEGTSTELWNSTGVQVLDEHSFESVDTDTITITASGSTTQVRSYYDSTRYSDLAANASGGFLRLTDFGGTSTLIRGYGNSEFYGGDLLVDGGTSARNIRNIREVSSVDYYSTLAVDASGRATFISGRSDNANTASVRATAGTDIDFLINSTQYMSLSSSTLTLSTGVDLQFNANGILIHNTTSSRDKIRLWNSSLYTIGFDNGFTYGGLNNDYAMTFQMNNDNDRGWWWGDESHTDAQGAMALTTQGKLTVASYTRIGYGESDTTTPGTTYMLQVNGDIQASDFVLSSDLRMKEDIATLEAQELDVTWKTFRFKNDDKKAVRHGVIAQELEEKHPEFVVTDDEGMKSVRYTDLLVAKMAEKDKQIESLEARVEKLEGLIANLVPSLN